MGEVDLLLTLALTVVCLEKPRSKRRTYADITSATSPGLMTQLTNRDSLTLTFEIAPPGMPPAFTTYIEARAQREQGN